MRVLIAHDVAHHVQKALGLFDTRYTKEKERRFEHLYRMELMADCLAGYYLARQQQRLSTFLPIMDAIGFDRTTGENVTAARVRDSLTHPRGQKRVEWFTRGFNADLLRDCRNDAQELRDLL